LVKAGRLTPRAAQHHRLRHRITRNLGNHDSAAPDLQCVPWAQGDVLLLCSDGLTNMAAVSTGKDVLFSWDVPALTQQPPRRVSGASPGASRK
jgi:protein phosphatase